MGDGLGFRRISAGPAGFVPIDFSQRTVALNHLQTATEAKSRQRDGVGHSVFIDVRPANSVIIEVPGDVKMDGGPEFRHVARPGGLRQRLLTRRGQENLMKIFEPLTDLGHFRG